MSPVPLKAEVGVVPEESGGKGASGNPFEMKQFVIDERSIMRSIGTDAFLWRIFVALIYVTW